MIITTDGRTFVYGVSDADGYECKDLDSLFHSEKQAIERVRELEAERFEFETARTFLVELIEVKS